MPARANVSRRGAQTSAGADDARCATSENFILARSADERAGSGAMMPSATAASWSRSRLIMSGLSLDSGRPAAASVWRSSNSRMPSSSDRRSRRTRSERSCLSLSRGSSSATAPLSAWRSAQARSDAASRSRRCVSSRCCSESELAAPPPPPPRAEPPWLRVAPRAGRAREDMSACPHCVG